MGQGSIIGYEINEKTCQISFYNDKISQYLLYGECTTIRIRINSKIFCKNINFIAI